MQHLEQAFVFRNFHTFLTPFLSQMCAIPSLRYNTVMLNSAWVFIVLEVTSVSIVWGESQFIQNALFLLLGNSVTAGECSHSNREGDLKGIKTNAQFYHLWFLVEMDSALPQLVQGPGNLSPFCVWGSKCKPGSFWTNSCCCHFSKSSLECG